MSELKIQDFGVLLRNFVDIGKPHKNLEENEVYQALSDIRMTSCESLKVIDQVSKTVCSLSKKDLVRFALPSLEVLDKPKLYFASDEEVIQFFEEETTYNIDVYPALHSSGALMVNMYLRFQSKEGISVDEAIQKIRINLRTLAIKIPEQFLPYFDSESDLDRTRFVESGEHKYLVGSLKDITTGIIRPMVRSLLQNSLDIGPIFSYRCLSSTLTQIYRTNPVCTSVEQFTSYGNFGREVLGMGTLHKGYLERSEAAVGEFLSNNLSSDEELGVFTFGLSDLLIFDNNLDTIIEMTKKKKNLSNDYNAILYNAAHYTCLFDWLYLEKFIIERYNKLLSKAIADEKTSPKKMLSLQKQSMHDLIVYRAGITPYPSREEFLEKARLAHRIPELQEKLEKKRDLATDYVLQEYTLRTNRGIQLVNIFVSATATFGLVEVLLSISQLQKGDDQVFWGGITSGLFFFMLLFLWGSINVVALGKKEKE